MVKKRMRRVLCGLCAALLLLVCVAPALPMQANASVIDADMNDDYSFANPHVLYWPVQLDIFKSNTCGIQIDNPLYAVGGKFSENQPFCIELPFVDESDILAQPLGRWTFNVEITPGVNEDRAIAEYGIQMDAGRHLNEFMFVNSHQFFVSGADLYNWLQTIEFAIPPGYSMTLSVFIHSDIPYKQQSGHYVLRQHNISFTSTVDNYVDDLYNPVWRGFFNASNLDHTLFFANETKPVDFLVSNMMIIGRLVKDEFWPDTDIDYTAGFIDMRCAVYDQSISLKQYGISDFIRDHPTAVELVQTNNFNFLRHLKTGVSGFLELEIVPGLSLAGILSACIGIGLVFVFLRFFGR